MFMKSATQTQFLTLIRMLPIVETVHSLIAFKTTGGACAKRRAKNEPVPSL